jgi:hypothetical protein
MRWPAQSQQGSHKIALLTSGNVQEIMSCSKLFLSHICGLSMLQINLKVSQVLKFFQLLLPTYQCHMELACSRLFDCMFVYHWVLRFSQGAERVAWRLHASMELIDRKVHPAALSKASLD